MGAAAQDLGVVDTYFDKWAKGEMTTKELRASLKKMGLSHDRLDPRQAGGSTTVYDASGKAVGQF